MGSSPTITAPPVSSEESALRGAQASLLKEQTALLKENADLNRLLLPVQLAQAGLKPTYDQAGKVIGYEKLDDPLQATRDEIEKGYLNRVNAALKGELPVNPALMKDLTDREALLKENLRKNLGSGWETSTPGIDALTKFGTERTNILDAARRGDLTMTEGLALSRESANFGRNANSLSMGQSLINPALALSTGFSSNVQGYGQAITPYAQDRSFALNAAIQSASMPSGLDKLASGFGQLAGTAVGAWAGGGFKKFW